MRTAIITVACLAAGAAGAVPAPLVVLEETGTEREGLPVLRVAPGGEVVAAGLSQGLSGTMLQLFALEQVYLAQAEGIPPEPAYLLLSRRQGGFPRKGFFLGDVEKGEAGYVDLHRGWQVGGRFGAMDQIFPHELMHVMREQLAGPLLEGGANQVHAVGVRTDRIVAFDEGLAEHLQAMALDDPGALPETRALARDGERYAAVQGHLHSYRRQMEARIALAPRMRLGFPVWWSGGEAVLRHFSVKENAFAREAGVPEHLLGRDPFRAYLLASTLPGEPGGAPKSLGRCLATEGVVAAFFHRFASDDVLRRSFRETAFYHRFAVEPADVAPEINVYLKLLHVFHACRPRDLLATVDGYVETFPDEAARVEEIWAAVFPRHRREAPREIWMANRGFETGTTLFDQFRGLPRVHTFDLNAASLVDLVAVEGVDLALARAILAATPVAGIDELARVPGVTVVLLDRFRHMEREMSVLREELRQESEQSLSLTSILLPYVGRALAVLGIAVVPAVMLSRLLRGPGSSWGRSMLTGVAASLASTSVGWIAGPGVVPALALGAMLGSLPALVALLRRRGAGMALRALAAWTAATLPGMALVAPWL